jgi:tRNA-dihydrouridine synthase
LIVEHYFGTPEVARRAAEAEAALEKHHYVNEQAMSFKEYVSRMTEQFELLEDNDQGLSDLQKVKQFLKGILSTHPDVRSIISQVCSQF